MQFTHDTEVALQLAAALVNTALDGREHLTDEAALDRFLREQQMSGVTRIDADDVTAVRRLRAELDRVWDAAAEDDIVDVVNSLFADAGAMPRLTRHDGWDWHLHLTTDDAPIVERLGTEAAMGLADLVRAKDLDRLKRCDAQDCDAVLVDLSRNRSRRYCDTGNCGNRQHVAAYRARKAAERA